MITIINEQGYLANAEAIIMSFVNFMCTRTTTHVQNQPFFFGSWVPWGSLLA